MKTLILYKENNIEAQISSWVCLRYSKQHSLDIAVRPVKEEIPDVDDYYSILDLHAFDLDLNPTQIEQWVQKGHKVTVHQSDPDKDLYHSFESLKGKYHHLRHKVSLNLISGSLAASAWNYYFPAADQPVFIGWFENKGENLEQLLDYLGNNVSHSICDYLEGKDEEGISAYIKCNYTHPIIELTVKLQNN